jgi:hypothetical protein
MGNLSNIGRIFYGIAITVLGLQTIYYHDFPYMLIPPHDSWVRGLSLSAYISGALLVIAGACLVFQKQTMTVALLLGSVLLLIFCFYFIPYELVVSPNYMHFGDWENSAKELALAGGAFVIASRGLPRKAASFGTIVFSLTILSFSIDHYLYAKEAVSYMPSWVSHPIFWLYLTGTALLGFSIGIILKIKPVLMATLLGTMIFIWFIILHIPKVFAAPPDYLSGEITSAFLALACCGIAFIIAGTSGGAVRKNNVQ